MERAALRHRTMDGRWVRRPLTDLVDLAEHVVRHSEALEIRPGR
ncbi:hypothetical protein [Actinomadura viridis]|uniref:Uncharacterized protein n=1 Tax=Actinomadura viridis TaxID=58110 RepID=A0A931DHK9_9ACTN|nr:hypothetical protein [Actinomadura viridis]MBG6091304.1 hypothetical protein [Actinomadura viridis]